MPETEHDGACVVDRVTGKIRVLSARCGTCLLRAGFHESETVRDTVRRNLELGTAVTCHETLPYGPYPEFGEAVCRGFYDSYRAQSQALRVAERLIGFVEVDPPPDPRRLQQGGESAEGWSN